MSDVSPPPSTPSPLPTLIWSSLPCTQTVKHTFHTTHNCVICVHKSSILTYTIYAKHTVTYRQSHSHLPSDYADIYIYSSSSAFFRMWLFLISTPLRQPHSNFGGYTFQCLHKWVFWCFFNLFNFMHFLIFIFIIPFRKFRLFSLGTATAASRAVLPSPESACWVFSCFHNPPNSDMDYRIFNARARSFLCVRIDTGVGHTDSEAAHFDWKTLTNISCALDEVRTSGHGIHWILRPTLYHLSQSMSHPVTPACTHTHTQSVSLSLSVSLSPSLTVRVHLYCSLDYM